MEENSLPLVEFQNISKSFPSVQALDDVSFDIKAGEVHALVGENGAGKSTLIKILMGVYTKDSGSTLINNESIDVKSPFHAQSLGLGAVYQDVNLAPHLSVAENFFMGNLLTNKMGIVDQELMEHKAKEILDSIDVKIDPSTIVSNLSVAGQEMVSIAKIIHQNSQVVVFDEPTALLTGEETEQLFDIIEKMRKENKGIIYISHRLEEIFRISDRVTVLKDGKKVKTLNTKDTNEDELISLMVGRDLGSLYEINTHTTDETILEVNNLAVDEKFSNINFNVYKGEIFGMFGLVGSGRTEIVRSIFGADKISEGSVKFRNERMNIKKPSDAIKKGIALIPENRREQGLALGLDIVDNTNVVTLNKISKLGVINTKKSHALATRFVKALNTKASSIFQKVRFLSGGNQQKVVISKWLAQDSDLFIFDEPTVGVDVGSKVEIYKIFDDLLAHGKTIILISSYLPEVMGLSDRILVMHEGRQINIVNKNYFDEEYILRLASGITDTGKEEKQYEKQSEEHKVV